MKHIFLILSFIILYCYCNNVHANNLEENNSGCLQLDIVIVCDFSGSVRGNERFIVDAYMSFIKKLDINEYNISLGIITFNTITVELTNLNNNKETILLMLNKEKINLISGKYTGGTTNMNNALISAQTMLIKYGRENVNKAIILISDGEADSKESTFESANIIKNLHNISICGILIENDNSNEDFMQQISSSYCYESSNYEQLSEAHLKLGLCF